MQETTKQLMTRSEFLRFAAAGALALGICPEALAAKGNKRIPIGLQLYSVRNECTKDLPPVLEAVAKFGYKGVEFAGYYDRDAKTMRKLLDDNGLVCCGTHTALETIQKENLEGTIEFNQILGNKYLVVPSMQDKTTAGWKKKADYFNEVADIVKKQEMRVGYHAHGHDFSPIDGEKPWDTFFGNTKKEVIMQVDTANCLGGGGDPVAMLKKYPGRATTIHLKEFGGDKTIVIGGGEVKWNEVLDCCDPADTDWFIIEHERGGPDPVGDVGRCLKGLMKILRERNQAKKEA